MQPVRHHHLWVYHFYIRHPINILLADELVPGDRIACQLANVLRQK